MAEKKDKPLRLGIVCSSCGADLAGKLPGEYETVKRAPGSQTQYFCKGMRCSKK